MRASSNASKPHSYGEFFSESGRCTPSTAPSPIGATPTARPTRMNSRIGKYSLNILLGNRLPVTHLVARAPDGSGFRVLLVPTSRLELLRLFRPLAPQASVSTNFTTWAKNSGFELSSK